AVSDVQLTRSGSDLIEKIAGTTDQVTVSSFFYNDGDVTSYALNAIRFSDGTSWDLNTIPVCVSAKAEMIACWMWSWATRSRYRRGEERRVGKEEGNDEREGEGGKD